MAACAGSCEPLEGAIAEFLGRVYLFRRAQHIIKRARIIAAGAVLFRRAAVPYANSREAYAQHVRFKRNGFALPCEAPIHPCAYVYPAACAVLRLHGGVELNVWRAAAYFRVYPEHGPERFEPVRHQRAEPILLHLICHNELLYMHSILRRFSFLYYIARASSAQQGILFRYPDKFRQRVQNVKVPNNYTKERTYVFI